MDKELEETTEGDEQAVGNIVKLLGGGDGGMLSVTGSSSAP